MHLYRGSNILRLMPLKNANFAFLIYSAEKLLLKNNNYKIRMRRR